MEFITKNLQELSDDSLAKKYLRRKTMQFRPLTDVQIQGYDHTYRGMTRDVNWMFSTDFSKNCFWKKKKKGSH